MNNNKNNIIVINQDNIKDIQLDLVHERKMTKSILGKDTELNLHINFNGQVMLDVIKQAVRMSKTDFGNMLSQWINKDIEHGEQNAVDWVDSMDGKPININVETAGHRPSAPITTNAVANQWKGLDKAERMKRLEALAKQVGVTLKM